jgi:FkbM family methyltransferase
MQKIVAASIRSCFQSLGLGISSYGDIEMLLTLPKAHMPFLLRHLKKSKSQRRQDLFVLQQLNHKSNGYFVEFGATNGVDISNTHLLETEFGWKGILAEPAKCWHADLVRNRKAAIELSCVWKDTGSILTFNEVDNADLSTISAYSNSDFWRSARETGQTYDVRTISLIDLLRKHEAPRHIDYLSIDTEGSEFEILNSFNFAEYSFSVITCEHNYSPMREKIYSLLSDHGYSRKFENISKYDDWYVRDTRIDAVTRY